MTVLVSKTKRVRDIDGYKDSHRDSQGQGQGQGQRQDTGTGTSTESRHGRYKVKDNNRRRSKEYGGRPYSGRFYRKGLRTLANIYTPTSSRQRVDAVF